jgi:exportin-7
MDQSQFPKFEALCSDLYNAATPAKRAEAHSVLNPMLSRIESVPQFEFVLSNSQNPHALLFAASGLMQLVTSNWSATTEQQRDGIKLSLSRFLAEHCDRMYSNQLWEQSMSFVIRLLCRIVKLSWLDGPANQKITEEIQPLVTSNSLLHVILGIDIYTCLTVDMQPTKGVQMSRLRRTAMSFRDTALPIIFTAAVKILRDIRNGKSEYSDARLLHKVLKLIVSCLSFDFMGTIPDETADEQATVMIPYNWTNVKDLSDPSLFLEMYLSSVNSRNQASCVLCLQCLVLFASFRRSLYSKEEERSAVISSYMRGTSQILSNYAGLDNEQCYHEFCRLLGRINASNQLTEISSNPQFSMWIDQVYSFTSTALNRINHLPNSMHYLLGFWTSLVSPTQTMGSRAPSQISEYLEKIIVSFLEFRIKLADSLDESDPLDDEILLQEQLDDVTVFSKLFLKSAHHTLVRAIETASSEKAIVWIVYLMSAVIAGQVDNLTPRRRSASVDDNSPRGNAIAEMYDSTNPTSAVSNEYLAVGDIVKRVLGLMSRTDNQKTSDHLEMSYLYFLEQFKKLYLSEQSKITSLTIPRSEGISKLCLAIGVGTNEHVIELFLSKIFSNFKNRKNNDVVVKKTLSFFHDLVTTWSGQTIYSDNATKTLSQSLLDNRQMQYLVSHHEEVDFGRIDKNYNTIYYSVIFRLLFDRLSPEYPIQWTYFDSLFARIQSNGISNRSDNQAKLVVTLARNLRGVCTAASTSDQYNVLFKYLVDNPRSPNQCKVTMFSALADTWWDQPEVVVPVIKFIADFAHNRSNRISFDANSPNGILLFREAAKVLSAYGQRMLALPSTTSFRDIYEEKYKGIGAALSLFTNILGGNYANLGVFELYGDTTLTTSMEISLKLCLSIPLDDLASFLKPLKSVYTFLELTSKSNMASLLKLTPVEFAHILRSLEDGLSSFETSVALSSCVAIDNICTYLLETTEGTDEVAAIRNVINSAQVPSAFSRILAIINHLAISGEFASTWSLSRPFLAVILVCPGEFQKLRDGVVAQQLTTDRRSFVEKCYTDLMAGIASNLSNKNREVFTKNLYQFGINMRSS